MLAVQASRAEGNQRVLVRKSIHQLGEYNAEQDGMYLEPVTTLDSFNANWAKYTSGLSAEELADLEQARTKLERYKQIYEIFEYASELNDTMYLIGSKVCSNNPTNPLNIYRKSESTSLASMFDELEKVL